MIEEHNGLCMTCITPREAAIGLFGRQTKLLGSLLADKLVSIY